MRFEKCDNCKKQCFMNQNKNHATSKTRNKNLNTLDKSCNKIDISRDKKTTSSWNKQLK